MMNTGKCNLIQYLNEKVVALFHLHNLQFLYRRLLKSTANSIFSNTFSIDFDGLCKQTDTIAFNACYNFLHVAKAVLSVVIKKITVHTLLQ